MLTSIISNWYHYSDLRVIVISTGLNECLRFSRLRTFNQKRFYFENIENSTKMYKIEVHPIIDHIIKVLQLFGLWRRNDNSFCLKSVEMIQKIFGLITVPSLSASLTLGAYMSDDMNETVYLSATMVASALMSVKLIYVIVKQTEIRKFLNEICVHSVTDVKEFDEINVELNNFAKFGYANIFSMALSISLFIIFSLPFFSTERRLPLNVGIPFDWRNSTISYALAHSFIVIAVVFATIVTFYTIIYWYIMFNCSIKYKLLGNRLRQLGEQTTNEKTLCQQEERNFVVKELIELIKIHRHIQTYKRNCT